MRRHADHRGRSDSASTATRCTRSGSSTRSTTARVRRRKPTTNASSRSRRGVSSRLPRIMPSSATFSPARRSRQMTVSPLQGITTPASGSATSSRSCSNSPGSCGRARVAGASPGWRSAPPASPPTPLHHLPPAHPAAPSGSLLLLAWVLALFLPLRHRPPREAGVGRVRAAGRHRARRAVLPVAASRRQRHRPLDVPAWLSGERFWGPSTAR